MTETEGCCRRTRVWAEHPEAACRHLLCRHCRQHLVQGLQGGGGAKVVVLVSRGVTPQALQVIEPTGETTTYAACF